MASSDAPSPQGRPVSAHDPMLQDDVRRLVDGVHADPHRILGYHDGYVRAWRPEAVAMRVVPEHGDAVPMESVHPAGLYEVQLRGAGERAPGYRLEADYSDGTTYGYHDPYRHWPTLGDLDLHLIGQGTHRRLWDVLGAHVRTHEGVDGTSFAVWAPGARSVRVVGEFNLWDGRIHPMRVLGSSGVWELFIPGVESGPAYKYEIFTEGGHLRLKADPMAFRAQKPPQTDSLVFKSEYKWGDDEWVAKRDKADHYHGPLSVYELHLGSWRRDPSEPDRILSYSELAEQLPDYVADMGFTHVEFMPMAEHPFEGSWGYQISSYYAPSARFGTPDGLKSLIDALHQRGIGVIVDWVPGHFPKDDWALARFDGSALYEHADPRQGEHPEWGTLLFNFGRHEVRNFMVANALYWIEEYHLDGLRVDGVASMLYLDYGRKEGEWVPNQFGGRENLEAVSFIKELNEAVYGAHPGQLMVAEESTSWPAVSRPTYVGGLGFGFKWNMGWMHDTLEYFSKDPVHRKYHHHELTFGLLYAFTENFVLPLSHDEVVHGKSSLLSKMPGDRWQKAANLRALLAWMWAHPGKQLLFMGGEFAQSKEWQFENSLEWHLLQYPEHKGVQDLVRTLNRIYKSEPALFERDFTPDGFRWIDASDTESNVLCFLRRSADGRHLACIANLARVVWEGYRVGLPSGGEWREVLNTDDT
ncbi:MAG TPA: 1,4-alpha-glucan branching protein GlgB, partial [Acidimicrobiales bacterium]|nr:1,4-alpha-glucan branching protein GlgB [Acidimicrobiales bacterium]